jgi:hypothetical protein
MPCPNKKTVRSYLAPDEYETVSKMANAAGISVSTFIWKVCLGQEIKSFEHEAFKLELIKTRSDMGKIGGLLKAALGLNQHNALNPPEVRRLLAEVGKLQRKLTEAVSKI